jgi:hypothetical protein
VEQAYARLSGSGAAVSRALGDAINARYPYLEVKCLGCNTRPWPSTSCGDQRQRRSMNWNATCAAASAPTSGAIPTSEAIWSRCDRPRFQPATRPRRGGRENDRAFHETADISAADGRITSEAIPTPGHAVSRWSNALVQLRERRNELAANCSSYACNRACPQGAYELHAVECGSHPAPTTPPANHDLEGWYKIAVDFGLPDGVGLSEGVAVLNELHKPHFARYPQSPIHPVPDLAIIPDQVVEHLISVCMPVIFPR